MKYFTKISLLLLCIILLQMGIIPPSTHAQTHPTPDNSPRTTKVRPVKPHPSTNADVKPSTSAILQLFGIPKEFRILNSLVTVHIDSAYCQSLNAWGLYQHRFRRIVISDEGKPPAHVLQQTFVHEFVHALLEHCGRNDLSRNELFVNVCAQALQSALQSIAEQQSETKFTISVPIQL